MIKLNILGEKLGVGCQAFIPRILIQDLGRGPFDTVFPSPNLYENSDRKLMDISLKNISEMDEN